MAITLKEAFPAPKAADVEEAVSRLVAAFDPLRIVVFGSYARNDADAGSDLDLLVVLPAVGNKREAAVAMRRELSEMSVASDVIVATPEELDRRRDSTWHIVGIALRDGKTVYRKEVADGPGP